MDLQLMNIVILHQNKKVVLKITSHNFTKEVRFEILNGYRVRM